MTEIISHLVITRQAGVRTVDSLILTFGKDKKKLQRQDGGRNPPCANREIHRVRTVGSLLIWKRQKKAKMATRRTKSNVSTCAVSSPGVDHAMRESAATSAETTTARLEKPAAPEVEMAFAVATSVSYSLAMAAASVVQPPESRLWTR